MDSRILPEEGASMGSNPWQYLALITQIGLTMVISILVGAVMGTYLDRFLGTTAVFTLLFIVLGAVSGFYSVYRLILSMSREDSDGE